MLQSRWIESNGGPLICMEKSLLPQWHGVDPPSENAATAETDYDRACRATKYIEQIRLKSGFALVIGDAPLHTVFYETDLGRLFLVRVWYCELDFQVDPLIRSLDDDVFSHPDEIADFTFRASEVALFDSAYPGLEAINEAVTFFVPPGQYKILTKEYKPDASTSLILHRFDRQEATSDM